MTNFKKLIFTKNEEKFIKDNEDIIYAGYWSSNSIKLKKNKDYLKCVWSSSQEKNKSFKYLQHIYGKYLEILSNYFNKYHNESHDKKYWEIICGIWLNTYLSSLYYRWNVVQQLSNNKKIIINNYNFKNFFLTTDNSIEYYSKISTSDIFNNLVFHKIINYFLKKKKFKPHLEKKKTNLRVEGNNKINLDRNFSFKTKILNKIISLLDLISSNKKNFLIADGFSNRINIKLNLTGWQLPFPTSKYFDNNHIINKKNFNYDKRNKNIIKRKVNDEFEEFLESNIYFDIPKIFLENFSSNLNLVKSYKIKCNKVISGSLHHYNELFKIWLAQNINEKKINFFITCHGGDHTKYHGLFNYEDNISDLNISWVKSLKHTLPAGKFIETSKKRKGSDNLIFTPLETTPYPAKWEDRAVCLDDLELDKTLINFQTLLDVKIKKKFYLCPKYFSCTKFQEIINKYLPLSQIKKSFSFGYELNYARLVICNNPQTAFIEAIRTGPTILILKKNQYRPRDILKKNYKELEKNKVIFYSESEAIKHVNEIWDDVNKWWLSKRTSNAVSSFLSNMNCYENSINSWQYFLSKK